MFIKDVEIYRNDEIRNGNYILSFKDEDIAKNVKMGQFVEIKVGNGSEHLLRKPISINDVIGDEIVILYKVVGKGTGDLTKYKKGDKINILGPVGYGFPKVSDNKELLIVAGGIGSGPFSFVVRNTKNWKYFYGCRDKNEIILDDLINRNKDKFIVSTDDGSSGTKGFVTDRLTEYLENNKDNLNNKIIFTCGPEIMMKKVIAIAEKYNVESYASLEEYMGCGIGACMGCVKKIKNSEKEEGWEYKKVCKDGPVFKGSDIIWD